MDKCIIKNCTNDSKASGLCHKHGMKVYRKNGTVKDKDKPRCIYPKCRKIAKTLDNLCMDHNDEINKIVDEFKSHGWTVDE
jgi:hypothetical protein